jgi:hypothetical protein
MDFQEIDNKYRYEIPGNKFTVDHYKFLKSIHSFKCNDVNVKMTWAETSNIELRIYGIEHDMHHSNMYTEVFKNTIYLQYAYNIDTQQFVSEAEAMKNVYTYVKDTNPRFELYEPNDENTFQPYTNKDGITYYPIKSDNIYGTVSSEEHDRIQTTLSRFYEKYNNFDPLLYIGDIKLSK